MISHEHQCIFVHIPKTAGNSINRVFGVGWENHRDLQRYFDETPRENFERYFKFAIVRNPWDRLLSDYNYQKKKGREKASKLFVFSERGRERDFSEWVEAALRHPRLLRAAALGRGGFFAHPSLESPGGLDHRRRRAARGFRRAPRNLPHDFRRICQHLGLPALRLPHRNRRLHWHYSHYYDRTTREIVAAYYARDIEQFGYEFEHALLRLAIRWPFAGHAQSSDSASTGTETNSSTPSGRAGCTVSFAASAPRRPPPVGRRRSLLAASLALVVAAFTFTTLNGESGSSSANSCTRSSATTTPPRSPRARRRPAIRFSISSSGSRERNSIWCPSPRATSPSSR